MQIVKDYRENKELRDSFNELAEKVFGLNFENWYRNGFWKDNYNPHSIVIDGNVVANVSVNKCNMNYNGTVLNLIQLGTVMTDPDYRGRGYSRILMEEVLKEYEGKADGMYLYANDSVLAYYPKFGFTERQEYQYYKIIDNPEVTIAENIPMETPEDWERIVEVMKTKPQIGNMTMVDNEGLFLFYLSQYMKETVYYIRSLDTYVVAETKDDTLMLHAAWGDAKLDNIIRSFGNGLKKAVLYFMPENTAEYEVRTVDEEDNTFFIQGKAFEALGDCKFMFQAIAHA